MANSRCVSTTRVRLSKDRVNGHCPDTNSLGAARFAYASPHVGRLHATLSTDTTLASTQLTERLGGIYALERIMRDSAKDHATVARCSPRTSVSTPPETEFGTPLQGGPA